MLETTPSIDADAFRLQLIIHTEHKPILLMTFQCLQNRTHFTKQIRISRFRCEKKFTVLFILRELLSVWVSGPTVTSSGVYVFQRCPDILSVPSPSSLPDEVAARCDYCTRPAGSCPKGRIENLLSCSDCSAKGLHVYQASTNECRLLRK